MTLVVFANAAGLAVFFTVRAGVLLAAVVAPTHPARAAMERAFDAYVVYATALLAVVAIGGGATMRAIARVSLRTSGPLAATATPAGMPDRTAARWRARLWTPALALAATTVVVCAFIEILIFQDYGVHFYEFDVFGILAAAPLRRDLGIQPAEVIRVTTATIGVFGAELVLISMMQRVARWHGGVLGLVCGVVLLVAVPTGLGWFLRADAAIPADRAELDAALPLGGPLLFRTSPRPYIAVVPRLGPGGYPTVASDSAVLMLAKRSNIVFFVADGLRGDMFSPSLTPNLARFGARADVIQSQRHISTGHVSEIGIFGLLYGVRGQDFNAFLAARMPSYPLDVLKRNGYSTFFLSSSRLSPFPSDEITRMFDSVAYPANDDEAMGDLARYVSARRADGRPYFVLAFIYTPHYPFTSAKPPFRRFPLKGPADLSNYKNDVLQADDYFRQTLDLVRDEFDAGKTILLATADHGEEIREHGTFGHASATFWNEKIDVPFLLGLPHAALSDAARRPVMSSHVDAWPTIFDYLGAGASLPPGRYSDGRSLLHATDDPLRAFVAGRFFPYADRPSVVVDSARKYWFRVTGIGTNSRLCVQVTRVTDLDDHQTTTDPGAIDPSNVPAFTELQSTFWHFIAPAPVSRSSPAHDCAS